MFMENRATCTQSRVTWQWIHQGFLSPVLTEPQARVAAPPASVTDCIRTPQKGWQKARAECFLLKLSASFPASFYPMPWPWTDEWMNEWMKYTEKIYCQRLAGATFVFIQKPGFLFQVSAKNNPSPTSTALWPLTSYSAASSNTGN